MCRFSSSSSSRSGLMSRSGEWLCGASGELASAGAPESLCGGTHRSPGRQEHCRRATTEPSRSGKFDRPGRGVGSRARSADTPRPSFLDWGPPSKAGLYSRMDDQPMAGGSEEKHGRVAHPSFSVGRQDPKTRPPLAGQRDRTMLSSGEEAEIRGTVTARPLRERSSSPTVTWPSWSRSD